MKTKNQSMFQAVYIIYIKLDKKWSKNMGSKDSVANVLLYTNTYANKLRLD